MHGGCHGCAFHRHHFSRRIPESVGLRHAHRHDGGGRGRHGPGWIRGHRGARPRRVLQEVCPRPEGGSLGNGQNAGQKDAQHGQELHGRWHDPSVRAAAAPADHRDVLLPPGRNGCVESRADDLQYLWPDQELVPLGHPDVQEVGPGDFPGSFVYHFAAPHRRILCTEGT